MSFVAISLSLMSLFQGHIVACPNFYPNEASLMAYMYITVVIVLFLNQQKTSQVIFGPKKIA